MGAMSIWHWVIVLAAIVLVFGTKKLRNMGGDLGAAVRGFKQGMKESDSSSPVLDEPAVQSSAQEARDEKTETRQ